jgi:pilus assembly protein CpaF
MFKGFEARVSTPAPQVNRPVPVPSATPVLKLSQAQRPAAVPAQDLNARATAQAAQLQQIELKGQLHEVLLEQLNLAMIEKVKRPELKREISGLVSTYVKDNGIVLRSDEFSQLVDDLLDEVLGFGPLEALLNDASVSDILVNSSEKVYVERRGLLEKTNVRFRDEKHLLRIIDKIVSAVGRRIDESQPWVDARLPDGSRVNAVVRPCAIDGPSLSIRKFSKRPMTLDRLIDHGALTEAAGQFLRAAVDARMNVLISGGTGSGKTTMLNAMSGFISQGHRVVTIEDAAELQLQQDHVVRLETRPPNAEGVGAIHQRDLVKNALRMRPDRIIVGEVRGTEAFDMLQAMNTGHDGSMTTIHANTARDAVGRLEQMIAMMGADVPLSAIRSQIAAGIHLIVQLSRLSDGRRRVMSITEVVGMEGSVVMMQDIFTFKKTGRNEAGDVLGSFQATGVRPRCAEAMIAAGIDLPLSLFAPVQATT